MAIKKEIWDKAKALFEQGLSLNQIELETQINRSSISKRAKKENWEKAKIQQLKADIKGIDKEKSTLDAKINTTVEKLSKLSDFEITILDEQIQDETGIKSLLFSTANLALIRSNQQLTKNTKQEIVKVNNYVDGRLDSQSVELIEVPLDSSDIKNHIDAIDKASLTLGVNQRHSTTQILNNNQNTNEIVVEIE